MELHVFPLLGGLARGLTRGKSKTIPFICWGGLGLASSSLQKCSLIAEVGPGRLLCLLT